MVMENSILYRSPIGFVLIKAEDGYVTSISTLEDNEIGNYKESINISNENYIVLNECTQQLDEYFIGKRKLFNFKYKNIGTKFRQKVWEEVEKIPYGTTVSYKDLAITINNVKAVRAVGGANHYNNLWIVVPCHRVIGSDGSLTGYGGGLWRKKWLLDHENNHM